MIEQAAIPGLQSRDLTPFEQTPASKSFQVTEYTIGRQDFTKHVLLHVLQHLAGVRPVTDFEKIGAQAELLTTQAEYWKNAWNVRREYEWKMTVGVWTLSLLAVGVVKQTPPAWITVGAGALIIGIYYFWLRGLWRANGYDRSMENAYLDQLDALLKLDFPERVRDRRKEARERAEKFDNKKRHFLFNWSMGTQFFGTVLLVALAVSSLVFWRRPETDSSAAQVQITRATDDAIKGLTQSNELYGQLSKDILARLDEIKAMNGSAPHRIKRK